MHRNGNDDYVASYQPTDRSSVTTKDAATAVPDVREALCWQGPTVVTS